MIHSMEECLGKLKAINAMAIQGVANSKGIEEKTQFESIAFEINYLINEARKEKDK